MPISIIISSLKNVTLTVLKNALFSAEKSLSDAQSVYTNNEEKLQNLYSLISTYQNSKSVLSSAQEKYAEAENDARNAKSSLSQLQEQLSIDQGLLMQALKQEKSAKSMLNDVYTSFNQVVLRHGTSASVSNVRDQSAKILIAGHSISANTDTREAVSSAPTRNLMIDHSQAGIENGIGREITNLPQTGSNSSWILSLEGISMMFGLGFLMKKRVSRNDGVK